MNLIYQRLLVQILIVAGGAPEVNTGSLIFFALLIIVIGLTSIIYPQLFWHLRVGRKVPNVKPIGLYLYVLRLGGVLVIALGLFMIYYII